MALTTRCPHCGTAFGGAGPVRIRNGLRWRLLHGVRRPGQSGAARGRPGGRPRCRSPCRPRLRGPPSRPMRFLPWFGPRLRLPGLPSRCRRGKTSLLSRNPRRGLQRHPRRRPRCAAANRSAGRRDQDARADELDDDELLDDELHDDESQDDEPRGGRRHGEDGHDDASGWRDRADERYPHSRPAAPPGRRRTRTRAPTSWMTMSCWTMSCMMTNRRTMNHGRSSSRRGRA